MAGLDRNMLMLIRALAENRIQDAKKQLLLAVSMTIQKRMREQYSITGSCWRMEIQLYLNFPKILKVF